MDGDQEDQTMEEEWDSDNWGSGETSVSGEGKLMGQLKIGREEDGMKEDQIESPAKKVKAWICEVCDREFSSGKALGGHMRVHGQASKEVACRQLKNQYQGQEDEEEADRGGRGGDGSSGGRRLSCSICAKDFPSIKSLSGHMRCHPGREWRGIHPPPPPPLGSDDLSAGVDCPPVAADLRNRLSSTWSATARRGRNALFAAARPPQSSESEEEEEEFEQQGREAVAAAIIPWSWEREKEEFYGAVIALARLSFGKSEPIQRHTVVEFETTNSSSPTNRADIEDNISGCPESKRLITGKLKGKSVLETGLVSDDTSRDDTDHDHDDDNDDDDQLDMNGSFCSDTTTINSMVKNKKRKKKFRDLDSVQGGMDTSTPDHHHHHHRFQSQSQTQTQNQKPNVTYKCSTCNKCFTNHQALGGHRSSHHKRRNLHGTTPEESSPPAAGAERCPSPAAGWTKAAKESQGEPTHQCKICSKTFPSGQALGGHQRSHWAAPSSRVTSPGESVQTGLQKVPLRFDLNELPAAAMEFEDGTNGQSEQPTGCCCPSSSSTSVQLMARAHFKFWSVLLLALISGKTKLLAREEQSWVFISCH